MSGHGTTLSTPRCEWCGHRCARKARACRYHGDLARLLDPPPDDVSRLPTMGDRLHAALTGREDTQARKGKAI